MGLYMYSKLRSFRHWFDLNDWNVGEVNSCLLLTQLKIGPLKKEILWILFLNREKG